jgi:hypothetical protein
MRLVVVESTNCAWMSKGRSLNLKSDQGHLQPRFQYVFGRFCHIPRFREAGRCTSDGF